MSQKTESTQLPAPFCDGWFREFSSLWPGQAFTLQVDEILYQGRSKYQDIAVFKSKTYGNVLVLDGVIQLTERDEFSYQEMISFLPLNSHPNPSNVLIIGGGDGGVLREVVKHPAVKKVTQCEIDEDVINVSKKYLPSTSVGFQSEKVTVHIGDGLAFMKNHKSEFDVIITDSSDPIGPASSLFEKEYYELMKTALAPGECQWLHLSLIKTMQNFCKTVYPVVDYAYTTIPTYPSGQIGLLLCSLDEKTNFREPLYKFSPAEVKKFNLRYYNVDVHRASFVLPEFARKALYE
ncbi:uncharacterized protein TRIADDRAFT_57643 [Trichoplax adhaerens]|uniref:Spermidine synthase n=1 Tax=Trichoplax adhaerens TaxID=10228 RepID=B3S011_TRIAD|nr:hypothetical protein TRIADDRAFT_57643 [Trichoplax adhaerens]EDV24307.1 hypothetical protein TRIADDRAFT_57643 [Trichoplax adhaerens]|eukprot:XP_002113833.1 hypothetical protein TRIADDRAFT_57643 [Trichoplax adhaerens]